MDKGSGVGGEGVGISGVRGSGSGDGDGWFKVCGVGGVGVLHPKIEWKKFPFLISTPCYIKSMENNTM